MGDHTESIQIEYDPSQTTYEQLLHIFWSLHDPTEVQSRQYRSAIFVHDENQRRLARSSLEEKQRKFSRKVLTVIEDASQFFDAEGYHQKYRLQNSWQLFRDLKHFTSEELKESQAATRLNGLAGGFRRRDVIEQEISSYGLSQQTYDYIHKLLNKMSAKTSEE